MFTRTCLLLMLSCFTVAAHAQIIGGNVNVLLGQRTMVDKAWEDAEVDNQIAVGLNVDLQLPLPVLPGIEFGFLTSEETGHDGPISTEVTVTDLFVGLNKTWNLPGIHPYVGGGLTRRAIDVDVKDIADDEDNDIGFYLHGGAFWRFGEHFNVGADLRYITGSDMDIFGDDLSSENITVALVLGYGF